MSNPKASALAVISLFIAAFLFTNCSSKNVQIDPKNLPPAIKAYKHLILSGGTVGPKDTGVYIENDDFFTIMATGSIDYCRGHCKWSNVRPELGWPLIARIGEDSRAYPPIIRGYNSASIRSFASGNLYLGYRSGDLTREGKPITPEYYNDDTGTFIIDIIVWEDRDYDQILDFLAKMKIQKPDSKALSETLTYFENYKDIYITHQQARREKAATEEALQKLKNESTLPPSSEVAATNQKQIEKLEAKLARLTATLAELDKMREELGVARQQIEEKEKREQQLLEQIASGAANPPILLVTSPPDGLETESKTVRLTGAAKDEQGLKQLDVFVNNRLIDDDLIRGIQVTAGEYPRRLNIERRIPLVKGENRVKIHVIDTDGLFTEKTLIVHHIARRRNVWAVVIGINDYPRVRKLKYAVNDAKAFYDLLVNTNQIPAENVFLLVNDQADLKQMRSTLGTRIKNKASRDDMVIIYFAGHGATERDPMSPDGDGLEKYLLPYDADPKDLYASALPMREITHIFNRIRAERLIFLADACYSGASGGRTVSITGVRANLSDAFLERISSGKGKIIITASSANEVSVEKDELGHGVFTYYLVQGLLGKADADQDGLITVDEAYRYVSDKVTQATGQEQHPVKKGAVEGQMVMGVIP
jgi:hypothetical protein